MALIFPGSSTCPVCERVIQRGDRLFATSGCAFPPGHPLFPYCDAGIHWDCFERWPERPRFAAGYVLREVLHEPDNPHYGRAFLDEHLFVCVLPATLRVHFMATSRYFDLALTEWPGDFRSGNLHELEWHGWRASSPALRRLYPSAKSLLAAVDWEAKAELGRRYAREKEERRAREQRQLDDYNQRIDALQGADCPHCRAAGPLRYLDRRELGRKSCYVCPACGRSAHLSDFT